MPYGLLCYTRFELCQTSIVVDPVGVCDALHLASILPRQLQVSENCYQRAVDPDNLFLWTSVRMEYFRLCLRVSEDDGCTFWNLYAAT